MGRDGIGTSEEDEKMSREGLRWEREMGGDKKGGEGDGEG